MPITRRNRARPDRLARCPPRPSAPAIRIGRSSSWLALAGRRGPADTAARVFAPYLAEALGQSVFIENRTGASSVIGTEAVVRAAPDGYTLLFGSSSSFCGQPGGDEKSPLSISRRTSSSSASSPTRRTCWVVSRVAAGEHARRSRRAPPGSSRAKLTYASSGPPAAPIHLASELFKARSRRRTWVHVPYRGGGPAVIGLLSGRRRMCSSAISAPRVENIPPAGVSRRLAMAWPDAVRRFLPETPTFAELGYPGRRLIVVVWPRRTGRARRPTLSIGLTEAMQQASASPGLPGRSQEARQRAVFRWTPAQGAAFIKAEVDKWGRGRQVGQYPSRLIAGGSPRRRCNKKRRFAPVGAERLGRPQIDHRFRNASAGSASAFLWHAAASNLRGHLIEARSTRARAGVSRSFWFAAKGRIRSGIAAQISFCTRGLLDIDVQLAARARACCRATACAPLREARIRLPASIRSDPM